MAEYINKKKVISLIEAKQKELCPNGTYGRGYVDGAEREKYDEWQEIINALKSLPTIFKPKIPCDLCIYNPPSSCDGKPCTFCPSAGKISFEDCDG